MSLFKRKDTELIKDNPNNIPIEKKKKQKESSKKKVSSNNHKKSQKLLTTIKKVQKDARTFLDIELIMIIVNKLL